MERFEKEGGMNMNIKEKLESMAKNSIELKIQDNEVYQLGTTRFGGQPDVPSDFIWPTYMGESYDHVVKERPLSFLAQFNCADFAKYDTEHLLPDHGLLSFFYELDSMCWGFDPKDKGCARVYWFEDISALSAAEFPVDMEEDFILPMVKIALSQKPSYPSWQDFTEVFEECDIAAKGYYLGNPEGWKKIPKEIRQEAEETAKDRWMLLLQLDTVECDDFELMFGDCGHIYFYITKEDLKARRFDNIWLILQCF